MPPLVCYAEIILKGGMSMFDFGRIASPIILAGGEASAYRDPAVYYENGRFYLFCTYVDSRAGGPWMTTVLSVSDDLVHWSAPRELTARDKSRNYSSPGNVVRFEDEYVLCLQTYCRENGEKYGNSRSRLYLMRSRNLVDWGEPELMRVKGDIPFDEMGRMIDPYLVEDIHEKGKWYCLYKQNGVSVSVSRDLIHWTYMGRTECGENVCALPQENGYLIFHSPANGIGMLNSADLAHFAPHGGLITLNQKNWPWAQGRITAGFVLDLTGEPEYGKYLLFFHGSGPENEQTMFDDHASIGLAWSDDLIQWKWAE